MKYGKGRVVPLFKQGNVFCVIGRVRLELILHAACGKKM
jgi:hypothetical protein